MDPNLRRYYGAKSGIDFSEGTVSGVNDAFAGQNYITISGTQPDLNPSCVAPPPGIESLDDCDFTTITLQYISDLLMEEDMEEMTRTFQESAALQAAERSLYKVLGEKYPPDEEADHIIDQNIESGNNSYVQDGVVEPGEHKAVGQVFAGVSSESTSQSSTSSSSTGDTVAELAVNSPVSTLRIPDLCSDSESMMQFKKGVQEATKFLPSSNDLLANTWHDELLRKALTEEQKGPGFRVVEKYGHPDKSRSKRHPHREDENVQGGRSYKSLAVYSEPAPLSPELFDMVLLSDNEKSASALREALQSQNAPQTGGPQGSNIGKSQGKKKGRKRNVVDLYTLLTNCAQAIAATDLRTANEFLEQIREHSSPTGDGMQRLAHYFAGGLEARIAGSGSRVYKDLISLPTAANDALKAYHLYLSVCPFRTISNFLANKTILNVSEKSTRLHIVDFGILWGFQWPSLIQHLSFRLGGPPKLRITGIDLPRPGFRPSARVDETGQRLGKYAETFKVPFEFNGIAQKWDTIKIEDLKIEEGEVLVVNSLFRLRYLLDETVMLQSPRNHVLNLIREVKPVIFIHGILNGAYNTPFFMSRFREALFHFTSMFDMLDTNIPREIHERLLIERVVFGRQAMNVISCEDGERIERPETYRQWQVRNTRAGFKQLAFNEEIVKIAKDRVKLSYHKDFLIDEDGLWVLHGWKGRTLFAVSAWRPAD